jgi:hypothetical protein
MGSYAGGALPRVLAFGAAPTLTVSLLRWTRTNWPAAVARPAHGHTSLQNDWCSRRGGGYAPLSHHGCFLGRIVRLRTQERIGWTPPDTVRSPLLRRQTGLSPARRHLRRQTGHSPARRHLRRQTGHSRAKRHLRRQTGLSPAKRHLRRRTGLSRAKRHLRRQTGLSRASRVHMASPVHMASRASPVHTASRVHMASPALASPPACGPPRHLSGARACRG